MTSIERDYDAVISLGGWCSPAANIRRHFEVEVAYPFDWWVTPFPAVRKVIEDRFSGLFDEASLSIVNDGESVLCRKYGILHHHDFARGPDGHIVDDLSSQLAAARAKYLALGARLDASVRGRSVLFIRENLEGADRSTSETVQHALISLHEFMSAYWSSSRIDLLYVDQNPAELNILVGNGKIFSRGLGPRIDTDGFWERNWDPILNEIARRPLDTKTQSGTSISVT